MTEVPWPPADSADQGTTEVVVVHESSEAAHDEQPVERPLLDLLVWDAPNIDMTLSNVIGGRPTPASRPRFDAVAR